MVRLNLYNQDLFCGAQAILWEMDDLGVKPFPSVKTINRTLARDGLTHRRTGKYESKGTVYPVLPSTVPNQTHQAGLVGPCSLKGPIRFYSLNIVDTATVQCGLYTSFAKSGQMVLDGFWAHGTEWEYRSVSRLIMSCLFSEAQHIPVEWVRLSDSASSTASSLGSYQWPNHGETE